MATAESATQNITVRLNRRTLRKAKILAAEAGISFWDALIVAAAARSGAARVLSEDLNPGQVIAGVTVVKPFEDSAEPPDAGNR